MSSRSLVLALLGFALVAGGLGLATFFGVLSNDARVTAPVPPYPEHRAGATPTPANDGPVPSLAPDEHEPSSEDEARAEVAQPSATSVARFRVCEMAGVEPQAQALPFSSRGLPWLAVHCGHSLHLLSIEQRDDAFAVRRVAKIVADAPRPQLEAHPTQVLVGDIDGDSRLDLIVPFLWKESSGAARTGALYQVLREPSGGFRAPVRLASTSTAALAARTLSDPRRMDLALVHLTDPHVNRPSELLLLRGGPAPLKILAQAISPAASAIAAIDVDADGHEELIVIGRAPEVEVLRFTGEATIATRNALTARGAREIEIADLDGDGRVDAVITGESIHVLLASAAPQAVPALRELLDGQGLRNVRALDVNADGKLDLAGLAPAALVALVQGDALGFERAPLVEFPAPAPLPVSWTPLSSQGEPRRTLALAVVGRSITSPTEIELSLLAWPFDGPLVWAAESNEIDDAPIALELVAR